MAKNDKSDKLVELCDAVEFTRTDALNMIIDQILIDYRDQYSSVLQDHGVLWPIDGNGRVFYLSRKDGSEILFKSHVAEDLLSISVETVDDTNHVVRHPEIYFRVPFSECPYRKMSDMFSFGAEWRSKVYSIAWGIIDMFVLGTLNESIALLVNNEAAVHGQAIPGKERYIIEPVRIEDSGRVVFEAHITKIKKTADRDSYMTSFFSTQMA